VDLVLVGADRATRGGDICTTRSAPYLKALVSQRQWRAVFTLACLHRQSTGDLDLRRDEIVIEERDHDEVRRDRGTGRPALALRQWSAGSESGLRYSRRAPGDRPSSTERGIAAPRSWRTFFQTATAHESLAEDSNTLPLRSHRTALAMNAAGLNVIPAATCRRVARAGTARDF